MGTDAGQNLTQIPIANLLRIAFYAGDLLEELEECEVARDEGAAFEHMLQAMLARAGERIRLRGLERGYSAHEEITSRPHGRLSMARSISTCAIPTMRLACEFDEFGADTPHNRVLKACARTLVRCEASSAHQDSLHALVREMREVSDVGLSRRMLRALPRSIATRRYRVVRFVARLLVESGQPDERLGEEWARRLNADEVRMRKVFERFVLRFAREHAPNGCTVSAQRSRWAGTEQERVPGLHTDVTIRQPGRARIIECKYVDEVLVPGRHGGPTYRPAHLFQLFGYLSRAQTRYDAGDRIDGVLLYPAVGGPLEDTITLGGFSCKIAQLGLAEPWSALTAQLRKIAFA